MIGRKDDPKTNAVLAHSMAAARPPEQIGLCLSGGGFRAAAFHLGVLSYLDRVGLLSRVTMLSTVSGGTITGARYVVSLLEKQPFPDFFRHFYARIEDVQLFKTALRILGSGTSQTPSNRRNLITSMAQTYCDELFFNEQARRPWLLGDLLDARIGPLTEVTFNATDFRTGVAFRFQKSALGKIGNYFCRLDRADAAQIRLGDIVAASSCFPGGFEPMEFPHDFAWPEDRVPEGVLKAIKSGSIGLMDGGIFDNQGIDSLMLADDRTDPAQEAVASKAEELDMFIMSDTNQKADNLFPFPRPATDGGSFWLRLLLRWDPSLGTISLLGRTIQALCLLTVISVAVAYFQSERAFDVQGIARSVFAFGIPLLLAGTTSAVLFLVRKQIKTSLLPLIPGVGLAGWNDLKRLKLSQVIDMLNLRTRSLLAMASQVFMKRIRQLGYRLIYENPRYDGKRVANYIYQECREASSVSYSSFLSSVLGCTVRIGCTGQSGYPN